MAVVALSGPVAGVVIAGVVLQLIGLAIAVSGVREQHKQLTARS